jgi:hypothetical protein
MSTCDIVFKKFMSHFEYIFVGRKDPCVTYFLERGFQGLKDPDIWAAPASRRAGSCLELEMRNNTWPEVQHAKRVVSTHKRAVF